MDCDLIKENDDFKKILAKCFQKDYHNRPTAEELFEDPFFAQFTSYL